MNPTETLTKEGLIAALECLNQRLTEKGVTGELCIYGGATMILAFNARESTRDVDAVFVPKNEIYEEAEKIAEEMNLPISWLNDRVNGYVSSERMPQWENLRIMRPTTRYLLAMKCMAARVVDYDTAGDKKDIVHLCKDLGINATAEILGLVEDYYPTSRIPVKTRYFIEEIVSEMKGGDE